MTKEEIEVKGNRVFIHAGDVYVAFTFKNNEEAKLAFEIAKRVVEAVKPKEIFIGTAFEFLIESKTFEGTRYVTTLGDLILDACAKAKERHHG